MEVFQEIPDGLVLTYSKGFYRQSKLFMRAGSVYAQQGSSFVRLHKSGGTSVPSISWKDIDPGQGRIGEDKFYVTYTPPIKIQPAIEAKALAAK